MSESHNHSNYLIVTHNARLRCLLLAFLKTGNITSFNANRPDKQEVQKNFDQLDETWVQFRNNKFKNGCVLKVDIIKQLGNSSNFHFEISLLFEGQLAVNELKHKKYWTTNDSGKGNNHAYEFPAFKGRIFNLLFIKESCTVYLVRHGQAEHNAKSINFKKDTNLTDIGKLQATATGKFLSSLHIPFKQYFCSDLRRTRETFVQIIQQLTLLTTDEKYQVKLVVLPCAHEVSTDDNGNCDGSYVWGNENTMNCNIDLINSETSNDCQQLTYTYNNNKTVNYVNIDWTFYKHFYGDRTRNANFKNNDRRLKCKDYPLSLISSLFYYLRSEYNKKDKSYSKVREIILDNPISSQNTVKKKPESNYNVPVGEDEDEEEYATVNDDSEEDEGNYYASIYNPELESSKIPKQNYENTKFNEALQPLLLAQKNKSPSKPFKLQLSAKTHPSYVNVTAAAANKPNVNRKAYQNVNLNKSLLYENVFVGGRKSRKYRSTKGKQTKKGKKCTMKKTKRRHRH
jgi:hypothetical protein